MKAVAISLGIDVRGGVVRAEGDIDFRGTLAVAKEAPVGFRSIRLAFEVESDADAEQLATLAKLTERYCVVWQSLRQPPEGSVSVVSYGDQDRAGQDAGGDAGVAGGADEA